jgi:hypothetical protein
LAARALQGDDAAFALLVSRHKGWAYQFVRRYVGNRADAYDVLQDIFFQLGADWPAMNVIDHSNSGCAASPSINAAIAIGGK